MKKILTLLILIFSIFMVNNVYATSSYNTINVHAVLDTGVNTEEVKQIIIDYGPGEEDALTLRADRNFTLTLNGTDIDTEFAFQSGFVLGDDIGYYEVTATSTPNNGSLDVLVSVKVNDTYTTTTTEIIIGEETTTEAENGTPQELTDEEYASITEEATTEVAEDTEKEEIAKQNSLIIKIFLGIVGGILLIISVYVLFKIATSNK